LGKQCTERNLKGERIEIDIIIAATCGMQINMVVANSHTVVKIDLINGNKLPHSVASAKYDAIRTTLWPFII